VKEIKITTEVGKFSIFKFNCVESTQTMAKELYRRYSYDAFVVWAERQFKGRGRRERRWHSPKGGLYFSLFQKDLGDLRSPQLVSLAAGMAIRNGLKQFCNISCELKWPNDILYQERKLCGILSESAIYGQKIHYTIVGVGINVNTDISELPCEVRAKATSLKDIIGLEVDLNELLSVSAEEVFKWLSFLKTDNGQKKVIESYKNHCVTLGSQVSVYLDNETISGLAVDITEEGALQVLAAGETLLFATGDVVHIRRDDI